LIELAIIFTYHRICARLSLWVTDIIHRPIDDRALGKHGKMSLADVATENLLTEILFIYLCGDTLEHIKKRILFT